MNFSDKKLFRKEILARRDVLPLNERIRKSFLISTEILDQIGGPLEKKTIAVYAAMKSEVSLDIFIKAAYQEGARLCFPCMIKHPDSSSEMVFLRVDKSHYEKDAAPFILNPLQSFTTEDPALSAFPFVTPGSIDVVLVPLVAFDSQNNRLGYGGGNYDRFLPQLRPETQVIGVAFEEQRVDSVPTEEHDCPLPIIVTE